MNAIDAVFARTHQKCERALIAYLTLGYPSLAVTEKLAVALWKAGVSVLELGIPFSDPIADGPTIQYSSQKALERGTCCDHLWPLAERIKRKTSLALVAMTYYNLVHHEAEQKFLAKARCHGIDGLIVPDLSFEESGSLRRQCEQKDIALIGLVAPTTPLERLRTIAKATTGFLYVVSVTGVTGQRKEIMGETIDLLRRFRGQTQKPLALGFGISSPKHAKEVAPFVDAVIVGSAFIQKLREKEKGSDFAKVAAVGDLARSLLRALNSKAITPRLR